MLILQIYNLQKVFMNIFRNMYINIIRKFWFLFIFIFTIGIVCKIH